MDDKDMEAGRCGGAPPAQARGAVAYYTLSEAVEGRGAHSVVRTAWSKRTREVVAVKCARKRGGVHAARLQAEVAILRQCSQLRHPNLVQVWIRRRRRPATGLHRHAATATTRSLSTPSKRPRRCSWFLSCCLEAPCSGCSSARGNCRKRTREKSSARSPRASPRCTSSASSTEI